MKLLVLSFILLLSGCASNCTRSCMAGFGPGNSFFDMMANHYDNMDVCQYKGKPEGYELPDFCSPYKRGNVYYVTDTKNRVLYKVTQ